MAKTRQQKEKTLDQLQSALQSSKAAVFANFQGLNIKETNELRNKCREQGVICVATKKTLMKKALSTAGLDVDTKSFQGAVAGFFGTLDEVAAAQIVAKFAKDHEKLTIFGGLLEGSFIDATKVTALSKLPSKQQLLGQLVGTINAPVSGFVNVLAGNLRGLVTVLGAIEKSKA
ncbi:MAG: 50S ribosomal protein L10 [Candidatus Magasanikbacteria bacterium]|jgi:large subunit ribosomal protein L10|nr:50S ribosomal protein L10 [Candidatus Magasanikbacteria bacterium]